MASFIEHLVAARLTTMHPPRVLAVILLTSIVRGSLAITFGNPVVTQQIAGDATPRSHMDLQATINKDDEEKMLSLIGVKRVVKSMMGLPKDIKINFLDKNAEPRFVYEHLAKDTAIDVENVLASSHVQIVEMYILEYNKLNPNGKKYLIDVIREVYGNNGAVTVILNARDDRSTKKLAIRLQTVLFKRWLNDEKMTVPNLLKLLGLKDSATFNCKRLGMLLEYVNVLAHRHRDNKNSLEDLLTNVTANMQELIDIIADLPHSEAERMLFQLWTNNNFDPENVIKKFSFKFVHDGKVHELLQRYRKFEPENRVKAVKKGKRTLRAKLH